MVGNLNRTSDSIWDQKHRQTLCVLVFGLGALFLGISHHKRTNCPATVQNSLNDGIALDIESISMLKTLRNVHEFLLYPRARKALISWYKKRDVAESWRHSTMTTTVYRLLSEVGLQCNPQYLGGVRLWFMLTGRLRTGGAVCSRADSKNLIAEWSPNTSHDAKCSFLC